MILIEERNSAGNAFYDKLKQTHEKNYLSCTRPICDKYWEEDDAIRARDANMGIVRKPRSDAEEKDIARHKEEWERYENSPKYKNKYVPTSSEDEDEDKLHSRQKKKHTKPHVGPRDAPTVSTVPKPCASNTEYLRWYNGVKTGAIEYNSFAAKPYIEYAKRLTGGDVTP
jgi:hypothetical protein